MNNNFIVRGVQFKIIPYSPDKKSALYEYERGAKYKLYKVTENYNIFHGLFSTKHAAKKHAAEIA